MPSGSQSRTGCDLSHVRGKESKGQCDAVSLRAGQDLRGGHWSATPLETGSCLPSLRGAPCGTGTQAVLPISLAQQMSLHAEVRHRKERGCRKIISSSKNECVPLTLPQRPPRAQGSPHGPLTPPLSPAPPLEPQVGPCRRLPGILHNLLTGLPACPQSQRRCHSAAGALSQKHSPDAALIKRVLKPSQGPSVPLA